LTPASGGTAEVYDAVDAIKYVEDIINLKQFIGGARSIAFLLGFAIVDILN
jgi:hypothetical protein